MQAELDVVGGKPVLRLSCKTRTRRAVFDLPLTKEQAERIRVHTELPQ